MPESAVVLLRASPQQYDQPHERKVDEIKENFTFAEHCNLDAEITVTLMQKSLHCWCQKHCSLDAKNTALAVTEITALLVTVYKDLDFLQK